MNVVVFGANGKVGSRVVARLLAEDHHVTAFVHGATSLPEHSQLRIFEGDVKKADDVRKALQGAQAVISALGSWGTASKDILAAGMQIIIPIMEIQGVRRIVSLTGSAAQAPGDQWEFFAKLARRILRTIAPKIIRDAERHITLLAASSLDWTVVRSPVMRGIILKISPK